MKKFLMLLFVLVLAVGLMACTTETEEPLNGDGPVDMEEDDGMDEDILDDEDEDEDTVGDSGLVLSTEELAEYNGKDGSPAYVAVDGVIYDVTNSDMWGEGEHNGFEAGKDLSDGLHDESPHGDSVLDNVPVVGSLED